MKKLAMLLPALLAPALLLPAAVASSASADTGLKPPLGGLLTRGVASSTEAPYLGGFDVVEDWSAVEPTRGNYDFSFIDKRLATARGYGMGVRVRIIAGVNAPAFAKSIGGAPMPAYDHDRKVQTTIGRFWTPAYQTAWQEMQATLATRYDSEPAVREVNVSGTGAISAEVMLLMSKDIVPSTGKTNGSYWLANGYTEAARQTALRADIDFTANAWPHTRVDLGLDAMQTLDSTGKTSSDTSTTMNLWDNERAAHANLNAFNTGFGDPVINGDSASLTAVYQQVISEGAPFDVQTLNMDAGIGDPANFLPWAANHGILSLELPGGKGWLSWSKSLLTSTNNQLKANAAARQ